MNRLHLQAVAFRQPNAHVMRRKTMRVLSSRTQLAREDKERLIAMIRLLETQLNEEREASQRWANVYETIADRNQVLRDRIGEWDYVSDTIRPCDIYDFLEEVGLDPICLPSRLSDVLAIRDLMKAVQS